MSLGVGLIAVRRFGSPRAPEPGRFDHHANGGAVSAGAGGDLPRGEIVGNHVAFEAVFGLLRLGGAKKLNASRIGVINDRLGLGPNRLSPRLGGLLVAGEEILFPVPFRGDALNLLGIGLDDEACGAYL